MILKVLGEVRGKYQFRLIAYVLMPDLHPLISEPKTGTVSNLMELRGILSDAGF